MLISTFHIILFFSFSPFWFTLFTYGVGFIVCVCAHKTEMGNCCFKWWLWNGNSQLNVVVYYYEHDYQQVASNKLLQTIHPFEISPFLHLPTRIASGRCWVLIFNGTENAMNQSNNNNTLFIMHLSNYEFGYLVWPGPHMNNVKYIRFFAKSIWRSLELFANEIRLSSALTVTIVTTVANTRLWTIVNSNDFEENLSLYWSIGTT